MEKTPTVSQVLWRVLWLNIGVTLAKIVIGISTGTISIVADGVHSAVDSASNVVGLIVGRIASQPPDSEHPYGHERYESIGTFIIGIMLLLTAWEVLQVAIKRLWSGEYPQIGWLQFAVLVSTLFVNIVITRYERKQAKRLRSELLAADAHHTASDIGVTLSVIVSLIAVNLGLVWMDALAALFIVGLIGFIAWRIINQAIQILVDSAPLDATSIQNAIADTPGVVQVINARSRGGNNAVQIDVDVEVAPIISAELAQSIVEGIRERLSKAFENIHEVRVQIISQESDMPDHLLAARAAADAMGVGVHEIVSVNTSKGRLLEMHVEVAPGLSLREAHDQINTLEHKLLAQDGVDEVITHIEPASPDINLEKSQSDNSPLLQAIIQHLEEHFPQGNWHHSSLRREHHGFTFSTHCHLNGDISLEEAHTFAEKAELSIRSHFQEVHRVIIHTEPR
ncbi:MAG: hypothetical protein CUN55_13265 [Phototrophicales bacterium]|nr:MAG: hypothetical protein CUN55_13265 [Phototrophicales bacterium]